MTKPVAISLAVALLTVACTSGPSWPRSDLRSASIAGTTALEDQLLPGVTLTLRGKTFVQTVVTDGQGSFRIADVPAGSYKLTARVYGASAWSISTELPPGAQLHLAIKLQRLAPAQISAT
ncbi:MAG: carboxypeptidase regulatory-like domain-containing protein [Alphaproteobacteria bacterium]|nr:carboxypeptidase regulatory-like domain-containing protein [Alphaproteobacteria bacterium]